MAHGAWPKYEYLKPWIIDQRPTTAIDVGINTGQFLHLADRLWPEAKIIGVEPTADLANKMVGLYQVDARAVVKPRAKSDHAGETIFHITKNSQNSSLLEPSASFFADRPDDGLLRTKTVKLRRMDDILKDEAGPFGTLTSKPPGVFGRKMRYLYSGSRRCDKVCEGLRI